MLERPKRRRKKLYSGGATIGNKKIDSERE